VVFAGFTILNACRRAPTLGWELDGLMGIAAMSHYADGTREDEMHERRKAKRERSFLRSRIYFNNGRNRMDCLIRDISYEGARVTFSEPADVPDEVQLYIPDRKRLVLARVRWRHADKLGLSFSEITSRRGISRPPRHRLSEASVNRYLLQQS
jgi:PilZ domain-containing protein